MQRKVFNLESKRLHR